MSYIEEDKMELSSFKILTPDEVSLTKEIEEQIEKILDVPHRYSIIVSVYIGSEIHIHLCKYGKSIALFKATKKNNDILFDIIEIKYIYHYDEVVDYTEDQLVKINLLTEMNKNKETILELFEKLKQ